MSRGYNRYKADESLVSLQRDNPSRRQTKKYSRVETLHSLGYSVKEIAQDSQLYMSLGYVKYIKSIIFNLSTKNIKLLFKSFLYTMSFYTRHWL